MGSDEVEIRELGTLVVVVGKARNLPNKSRFGKQDPFCTLAIGEERQKTKPIKRGGQHPEWDEELRFSIFEDVDDVIQRSDSQSEDLNGSLNGKPAPLPKDSGVITSAALANKSRKGKKKGGKSMRIQCYADDAKEPELIGDCVVDLDEALKKGEVDEWYEFQYRDKYSGEVYLELTFFSNDAPPVRRNVPRPSIPGYSTAGSLLSSGSSMSLNSVAGKGSLSSLGQGGSISGANLYIPPYAAQAARVPSPVPSSNSFGDLGLPPGHRPGPAFPINQPPQAAYPPRHTPSHSLGGGNSIEALTRPMTSMSLNPPAQYPPQSSTPAPPAASASSLGHSYGAHRHSFGGPSDAPWGSMLPQSQLAPAPTPHPRPLSTSDAMSWEQQQRLEMERLRSAATPAPRPTSVQSQGYGGAPGLIPPMTQATPSQDYRAASPIPASLRPGGPPQLAHQPYSQPPPASAPTQYLHQPPTPAPPPLSHSAPPTRPPNGHYGGVPASSYGGLAQPPAESVRAASPGPTYYQPQAKPPLSQPGTAYQSPAHTVPNGYGSQPEYGTPTRSDSYPAQDYQQTPPSAQGYNPAYAPPQPSASPVSYYSTPHAQPPPAQVPAHSYSYSQSSTQPPRQLSPAPPVQQQQQQTNEGGYVPWYQQTQSTQAPQAVPQPPPTPSYADQYGQSVPQQSYGRAPPQPQHSYSLPPPPVPERRPSTLPAPPVKPSVGYYPSDELYAQPLDSRTPTPTPPGGSSQGQQNWQGQGQGQNVQQQQWQTPPAHQQVAQHSHQREPAQSWQTPPQQATYGRTPSPQPPVAQDAGYAAQQAPYPPPTPQPPQPPQQHQHRPSQNWETPPQQAAYGRAPSPQPPVAQHPTYGGQQAAYLSQTPQPPQPQQSQAPWQSQTQGYQSPYHSYPPSSTPQPVNDRQPSPQPPQQQGYQPPHPAQSYVAPLAAPIQQQAVSNTPPAKVDWRTYMQNLGVAGDSSGAAPGRAASPQTPPKDGVVSHSMVQAVAQQQHQQAPQQTWYTPPPSLPNTMQPPDGWQSTLPAQRPW
ncbi:hypothetical protein B9479_007281 [Cryptococcus floricola]|uniref:C2 domain-containing protein n=1 Tax=Cryptococcus floricola TaxID=2591691 RepID=A0A5D3AKS6_9TREE|nr:hypothetical protein B9479_007281 [Cryptococcus floricola]